jgi:hypothetical protein
MNITHNGVWNYFSLYFVKYLLPFVKNDSSKSLDLNLLHCNVQSDSRERMAFILMNTEVDFKHFPNYLACIFQVVIKILYNL